MLFWDSWGRFPAGKLSPHGSTANCTAEVGGSHSALSAWKPREKKPHHHQTIGSRLTLPPLIKLETHHCRNKGETVSRKDIDIAAEKAPAAWAHLVKIMTATNLVTPGKGKTTGADLVGTCPYNVWDGMQISQSPREDTMKKSEWSPHLARHRYTWGGGSKISTHLGALVSFKVPAFFRHWGTPRAAAPWLIDNSTAIRHICEHRPEWLDGEGGSLIPSHYRKMGRKTRFSPASVQDDTWQLLEHPHIF